MSATNTNPNNNMPQMSPEELGAWMRETEKKAMAAIRRCRGEFIMTQHFFGCIAMDLKMVQAWSIPTAAVDDIHLFYNPSFIMSLNKAEQIAVMAHEILHVACSHSTRMKGRDHEKWNVACDFAINLVIDDMNVGSLPSGALLNNQYAGMTAETIYNILPELPPSTGQGRPGVVVFDGPFRSISDPAGTGGVISPRNEDGTPCTDIAEISKREARLEERMRQAKSTAEKAGHYPEIMERIIDDALVRTPDWKEILHNFVANTIVTDSDWRRLNKRYRPHGIYLPSLVRENTAHLALLMDTSGSIDDKTLGAFKTNINIISQSLRLDKVTLIWFTTRVEHVDVYEAGDEIVLESRWSGGTCFNAAFEYVRNMADPPMAAIVFTDLEVGSFPNELDVPTIFANYNKRDPKKTAPYGETINITD